MDIERLKDFYRGKTVLVTGHTGFKGAWLSHVLLGFGARVVGVSLPPRSEKDIFVLTNLQSEVEHHEFDIRNTERLTALVTSVKPDVVFHLAAQALVRRSYDEPLLTATTNVLGTANVLEAVRLCESVQATVIVTTDKVYENKEWIYGYRENEALGGYDLYSGSKAAADLIANAYRQSFFHPDQYGLAHNNLVGIARAGNVVGGGDWAENRLVPDIMRAALYGDGVVTLRSPGSVRPWEHVLEPLSGYLLLGARLGSGEKELSGAWNFGPDSGSWVTVGEVTDLALAHLGRKVVVTKPDNAKHEANELVLDTTKAARQLGWRSRWNIEKTVAETAGWYREVHRDPSCAPALTRAQITDYFGLEKKSL